MIQSIWGLTVTLWALLLPLTSAANEAHYANPTKVVISGTDIYGNDTYQMTFDFQRTAGKDDLISLRIKIYDKEISAGQAVLEEISNVHFDQIDITNDAGVFGSYFYGSIPYGPVAKCRKARRQKLSKYIYFTNLDTMNGGGIKLTLRDPCRD